MLSKSSVHPVPLFAALGAASGLSTVAILHLGPRWSLEISYGLDIWPMSVVPGLVFGFVIGFALLHFKWVSPAAFVGYVLAATVCNCAAVMLTTEALVPALNGYWLPGILAGLFGSACLTGCTLALIPAARKPQPIVLTILAGGAMGALLGPAETFGDLIWWLAFYGLWQSAYAASLATALPRR